MISVNTYNQKGEVVGKTQLNEQIFGLKMNHDLVQQAVVAQMANKRQVLANTKDKGEVRGGGRKPWRQKGTGRARHGSIRSPLWKGGGVTFGPTSARNFTKKINQKMKTKALFIALSSKVNDNEMVLLDDLNVEPVKTKTASQILVELFGKIALTANSKQLTAKKGEAGSASTKKSITKKQIAPNKSIFKKGKSEILLVLPAKDEALQRAFRNLPYLKIILADSLNVVDVLQYKHFLVSKAAIDKIEKHFVKLK